MLLELIVALVVIAFDGGFLNGAVHTLDLSVRPGMIGLGCAVLDAIGHTHAIEQVNAQP